MDKLLDKSTSSCCLMKLELNQLRHVVVCFTVSTSLFVVFKYVALTSRTRSQSPCSLRASNHHSQSKLSRPYAHMLMYAKHVVVLPASPHHTFGGDAGLARPNINDNVSGHMVTTHTAGVDERESHAHHLTHGHTVTRSHGVVMVLVRPVRFLELSCELCATHKVVRLRCCLVRHGPPPESE